MYPALFFLLFFGGHPTATPHPLPPHAHAAHPNWGFFGHKAINRNAVFTLPPEMAKFYKANIDYVVDHSVDPDKRRRLVPNEGVRHYIDLDRFGKAPFPNLPRRLDDALLRYVNIFAVTDKGDTIAVYQQKLATWDTLNASKVIRVQSDSLYKLFNDATATLGDSVRTFSREQRKRYTISALDFRTFYNANVRPNAKKNVYPIAPDSLKVLFNHLDGVDAVSDTHQQGMHVQLNCVSAFATDGLTPNGIVPYYIAIETRRLAEAFRHRDRKKILRLSADLGHYIADAHVPLHTTENYDGQLTDQKGIHSFWESRLPELFADKEYNLVVGKAEYVKSIDAEAWRIVLESNALLDSVLLTEKALAATFPPDQQMCDVPRGRTTSKQPCEEFSRAWHSRMNGMVEARMRAATKAVGDAWMTAWVNAGQPDLDHLDEAPPATTEPTPNPETDPTEKERPANAPTESEDGAPEKDKGEKSTKEPE